MFIFIEQKIAKIKKINLDSNCQNKATICTRSATGNNVNDGKITPPNNKSTAYNSSRLLIPQPQPSTSSSTSAAGEAPNEKRLHEGN
jgi:hypothetical protein